MKKIFSNQFKLLITGFVSGFITMIVAPWLFFYVFLPIILPHDNAPLDKSYTVAFCLSEEKSNCLFVPFDVQVGNTLQQTFIKDTDYHYININKRRIDLSSWQCRDIETKKLTPLSEVIQKGESYECWPKESLPKNIVLDEFPRSFLNRYPRMLFLFGFVGNMRYVLKSKG